MQLSLPIKTGMHYCMSKMYQGAGVTGVASEATELPSISNPSLVGILETVSASTDVNSIDCSIGEFFFGGLDPKKRKMSIFSTVSQ